MEAFLGGGHGVVCVCGDFIGLQALFLMRFLHISVHLL